MRSKHKFWPHEYAIAITTGRRTRYFYGASLKDAITAAGKALKVGQVFSYAKFQRGKITVAEVTKAVGGAVRAYRS